jgi:phage terminase large subunit
MGGRGAGRSTVASQFANAKLIGTEYYRCAIMRYILGDIRNSIYREIVDRAEENGIKDSLKINDSTMAISYGENTINAVGFRKSSGDQKSKLKSLANYNCVIIEEADEIPEEDFMQLDDSLRTVKGDIVVILLLNPPAKNHWIIQRWFDLIESGQPGFYVPVLKQHLTDTIAIRSDYKDNIQNIAKDSIIQYENYHDTNPDHYWHMIRGYVPEVLKGKIYSGWEKIKEVPKEARLERYGLDFGYTNDPTAVVAVYKWNNAIILDEIIYKKGMLNSQIAKEMLEKPSCLIVADSAEPKSIDELQIYGLKVLASEKGQGSVLQGIQAVQNRKIYYTERSKNIEIEYENYAWKEDKEGTIINTPKPGYDHICDAIRYAIVDIFPIDRNNVVKKEKTKGEILLERLKAQKSQNRSWR